MSSSAKYPVLQYANADVEPFVEFWAKQYRYRDESLYDDNIGKPITESSMPLLTALFQWKNGGVLSAKKTASITQYLSPSERISSDCGTELRRAFLNRKGGAIWRIFWLHIQHPNIFPIYDQHVHRAMASLRGWANLEISINGSEKVNSYLDHYIPFVKSLEISPLRTADRALWAYGRFLTHGYNLTSP